MSTIPFSRDIYLAMIEQTGQAFFAYEVATGKIVYQNAAFQNILKLPEDSLTSERLLSFVHPEDQEYVQEEGKALLENGTSRNLEVRLTFPHQQEQWICLQLTVGEYSETGQVIIGHVQDITANRHYNDHLKKFSNKKNSVLNILSHDLAGPLGMIRSLSEMVAQDWQSMPKEEMLEIIQMIERSSRQGSKLIQEFMEQEFMESSQTSIVTRRVNIVEKLQEAVEEYLGPKNVLINKTITFLPPATEIYAEADDLKLLQVLTNLISNALKFTPDGGTITVTLQDEELTYLITVADTGVGIPAENHAVLFEKFTPARRPGLKGEPSIGLGMSIVKTIIEWHQGSIWFESQENKGTTFYLRLPKHPHTSGQEPAQ